MTVFPRSSETVLSVSSNGSTWVKPRTPFLDLYVRATFSILERIDVGETQVEMLISSPADELSVSSNGSTWVKQPHESQNEHSKQTFSILERIDVGETKEASTGY